MAPIFGGGMRRDLAAPWSKVAENGLLKNFFCFLIFGAVSLVLGLGSANYMISDGFSLVVGQTGPWKAWVTAGGLAADPYTKAHIARSGDLPITSASGLTFFASTDSGGRELSSYCDYEIVARPLSALWWTIAVFDEDGKLIPNKAARHAFNSQSLTILPDGTQRINLAPEARPGHWLPSGEGHDLILVLRIIRPLNVQQQQETDINANAMPVIKRISC
jgi:hypothetical protein